MRLSIAATLSLLVALCLLQVQDSTSIEMKRKCHRRKNAERILGVSTNSTLKKVLIKGSCDPNSLAINIDRVENSRTDPKSISVSYEISMDPMYAPPANYTSVQYIQQCVNNVVLKVKSKNTGEIFKRTEKSELTKTQGIIHAEMPHLTKFEAHVGFTIKDDAREAVFYSDKKNAFTCLHPPNNPVNLTVKYQSNGDILLKWDDYLSDNRINGTIVSAPVDQKIKIHEYRLMIKGRDSKNDKRLSQKERTFLISKKDRSLISEVRIFSVADVKDYTEEFPFVKECKTKSINSEKSLDFMIPKTNAALRTVGTFSILFTIASASVLAFLF